MTGVVIIYSGRGRGGGFESHDSHGQTSLVMSEPPLEDQTEKKTKLDDNFFMQVFLRLKAEYAERAKKRRETARVVREVIDFCRGPGRWEAMRQVLEEERMEDSLEMLIFLECVTCHADNDWDNAPVLKWYNVKEEVATVIDRQIPGSWWLVMSILGGCQESTSKVAAMTTDPELQQTIRSLYTQMKEAEKQLGKND